MPRSQVGSTHPTFRDFQINLARGLMNKRRVISILPSLSLAAIGGFLLTGQSAIAQTVTEWDYAIDAFNDSVSGLQIGGGEYEFFGLGFKEEGNNIFIALNANMPITGASAPLAEDKVISWGDLFFNFSGNDFSTASNQESLYAIRFAASNNSKAQNLGVYRNVKATSVTAINSGFSSLSDYNATVQNALKTPSLADLPADTAYFNQSEPVLNAIANGKFVTDIQFLDSTQLSQLGLNFHQFDAKGTETIGFSFDKKALPTGEFIANIFAECANDGMVLQGEVKPVPEPFSLAGSLVGLGLLGYRQWRQRKQRS